MPSTEPGRAEEVPYVPRNFWAWVAYQFCFRVGWQFKMESTMMAGLVSYLAPDPRVAGLFTALNNVGRNLAPLVAAPLVDRFRQKRAALLLLWGATVAVWAVLTVYLWLPQAADRHASVWIFGVCYTLFFVCLGASSVAQGTLLGRIIPAEMRGRSMAAGMGLSGVVNVFAILLVYRIVKGGGFPEPRNYALSFTLTTSFFALAALSLLWISEKGGAAVRRSISLRNSLGHFVRLAREDSNLARLMTVNVTVGVLANMLQFYTLYWRQSGTLTESSLILATLFQVFWQSLSSTLLGRVADQRGNRAVICCLLWVEAVIPLAALVFGGLAPFRGHWGWYLVVYTLIGVRFPVFQLLVNYLLEVVPQREHAMALGAVNAAQLVTAAVPLLFGAIAAALGYPAAFVLGSVVGICGASAALTLKEVRVQPECAG